jgi:hypothetical protein
MNPETWRTLEAQAQWTLAHVDQCPPREALRGMGLQLRLWRYPRSGPHLSWSLIIPVRDYRARPAVIREASWDRSADWQATMGPMNALKRRARLVPSIRLRDADVDWSDLAPFLDAAGRLPVERLGTDPSLPSEEGGCGLEGFRSLAHVRLEWAGKGPRGWGATITWFEQFRRMLVRIMEERATPNGGR